MDISIADQWQEFVAQAVKTGRFGTASDVINEGLRLMAARDATLAALRDTLNGSISAGGAYSDDEIGADLDNWVAEQSLDR